MVLAFRSNPLEVRRDIVHEIFVEHFAEVERVLQSHSASSLGADVSGFCWVPY
jgi:hypothetical protein